LALSMFSITEPLAMRATMNEQRAPPGLKSPFIQAHLALEFCNGDIEGAVVSTGWAGLGLYKLPDLYLQCSIGLLQCPHLGQKARLAWETLILPPPAPPATLYELRPLLDPKEARPRPPPMELREEEEDEYTIVAMMKDEE
ncbi:hypothetical protein XENOCAPTIV_017437, partial [Xenoophorus captivus]